MTEPPEYEVVVIGGGPAGLTTALYATRLGHRTAVVERGGGRHTTVAHVHNLTGVSEEISGDELSERVIRQLEEYGADYYEDDVASIDRVDESPPRFRVDAERATLSADRVVLATGFSDESPGISGLQRFVGRGLHYCLHCDAYALGDAPAFVLGNDGHAAHAAMVLLNFTDDVDLLLNGADPTWNEDTADQVEAHPIAVESRSVVSAFPDGEDERRLGGLEFADGSRRTYVGGFAMYGRRYHGDLAEGMGCELRSDGAVAVDGARETSVDGAYAVGDVTHGQNQTPIAMGDGAYAGIAIHEDLRTFPVPADEIDADDRSVEHDAPAAPADLRARMRRVRERDDHAGLTPSDDR